MDYKDLYDFQKEVFVKFDAVDTPALFMDMGTGKTPTTITMLRARYADAGGMVKTLIFCPIIVLKNWKDELLVWSKIPKHCIGIVKGTAKKRLQIIEDPNHRVLIANYECLRSKPIVDALKKWQAGAVVCDESHRIKTATSIAFKKVMQVSAKSKYRFILSGTPVTNDIRDLWAQYMFLDHGRTFGAKFSTFRMRYMVNENAGWQGEKAYPSWVVNNSRLPEVKEKLARTSYRITTEEAVELPELVTQTIEVELSTEQKRHYKELATELITWLDSQPDNPQVVQNALTKLLRLNEISAGYMKLLDDSIHKFKTNPRLEALVELVKQTAPHKVIIYSVFKQTYKDIAKAMDDNSIEFMTITGDDSTDEKLAAAEAFKTTEAGPRVVICNTRAAGLGINLTGARYKVYYTRNFSLDDYLQSQKRNYRAGAVKYHSKVTDYQLVAPDTIDEVILERVLGKKKFATSLLDIKKLITDI